MDMNYIFSEEIFQTLEAAISGGQIVYNLLMMALGIAGYFLRSIGLYSIAKRRGINNPWLAWIPVAWVWVLGSISDQFRYVTKAQVKNKRKVLLVLSMVTAVLVLVMLVFGVISMVDVIDLMMAGMEDQLMGVAFAIAIKMLAILGLVMIVAVVHCVFYYIALYDLYASANPNNSALFLVLGIFFRVTEPFFIFFNRKKDGGMPPRCNVPQEPVNYVAQPAYIPAEPVAEPVNVEPQEAEIQVPESQEPESKEPDTEE